MMTKLKTVALLFVTILGLNACSGTFDGVGKDMEKAGEWVQDTF